MEISGGILSDTQLANIFWNYSGRNHQYINMDTIIQKLGEFYGNHLFIKREDLIPFSFGGNKARKAKLFFEDFENGDFNCIVTYGSSSSNHCRIIANICASRKIPCYIISPLEIYKETFNSKLIEITGGNITIVPVRDVSETIDEKLAELKSLGYSPYFIPGGGHGNIGTRAYVKCYEEIMHYDIKFDYIFFASGTGTTQAGLVVGSLLNSGKENIVGISIARKNPYGRTVIIDSVYEYLAKEKILHGDVKNSVVFVDDYVGDGYGKTQETIKNTILFVFKMYGIPLDATYTGKAFYGMKEYIRSNNIVNSNILFIHTGGTPLFFDFLSNLDVSNEQ